MIKAARKVRDDGVLAWTAQKNKRKPLVGMTKRHVAGLNKDDRFSRLCPGIKHKVNVLIIGIKTQMQKRNFIMCIK